MKEWLGVIRQAREAHSASSCMRRKSPLRAIGCHVYLGKAFVFSQWGEANDTLEVISNQPQYSVVTSDDDLFGQRWRR